MNIRQLQVSPLPPSRWTKKRRDPGQLEGVRGSRSGVSEVGGHQPSERAWRSWEDNAEGDAWSCHLGWEAGMIAGGSGELSEVGCGVLSAI